MDPADFFQLSAPVTVSQIPTTLSSMNLWIQMLHLEARRRSS